MPQIIRAGVARTKAVARRVDQDFIVRIYRRTPSDPRLLVGTVERVGDAGKHAFATIDELWAILLPGTRPLGTDPGRKGSPKAPAPEVLGKPGEGR